MRNIFTKSHAFKHVAAFTLLSFFVVSAIPSQALAQGVLGLPQPGSMVLLSSSFHPALLRGIQIQPNNPLRFDFIVDTGETGLEGKAFEAEATKLIKYFLASLTIPEEQFWVNLSPYEKERIIADSLGETEMGRDLLAQDYVLKQLTATLVDPNSDLGKKFWERVYKKAYEMYGTTQIPANTFNKIWITPDEAVVYEEGNIAFVGERHLKVMLEEDYLSLQSNAKREDLGVSQIQDEEMKKLAAISSGVVRDVLVPEIEKEVNGGKLFANLRQIFNSMILATWYKKALKESLLGQVYVDKNKTKGVDVDDKTIKEQIYQQYLESFKKGVFNMIKVEKDAVSGKNIPRKYFSGGVACSNLIVKVIREKMSKLLTKGKKQFNNLFMSSDKKGKMLNVSAGVGTDAGLIDAAFEPIDAPSSEIDMQPVSPFNKSIFSLFDNFADRFIRPQGDVGWRALNMIEGFKGAFYKSEGWLESKDFKVKKSSRSVSVRWQGHYGHAEVSLDREGNIEEVTIKDEGVNELKMTIDRKNDQITLTYFIDERETPISQVYALTTFEPIDAPSSEIDIQPVSPFNKSIFSLFDNFYEQISRIGSEEETDRILDVIRKLKRTFYYKGKNLKLSAHKDHFNVRKTSHRSSVHWYRIAGDGDLEVDVRVQGTARIDRDGNITEVKVKDAGTTLFEIKVDKKEDRIAFTYFQYKISVGRKPITITYRLPIDATGDVGSATAGTIAGAPNEAGKQGVQSSGAVNKFQQGIQDEGDRLGALYGKALDSEDAAEAIDLLRQVLEGLGGLQQAIANVDEQTRKDNQEFIEIKKKNIKERQNDIAEALAGYESDAIVDIIAEAQAIGRQMEQQRDSLGLEEMLEGVKRVLARFTEAKKRLEGLLPAVKAMNAEGRIIFSSEGIEKMLVFLDYAISKTEQARDSIQENLANKTDAAKDVSTLLSGLFDGINGAAGPAAEDTTTGTPNEAPVMPTQPDGAVASVFEIPTDNGTYHAVIQDRGGKAVLVLQEDHPYDFSYYLVRMFDVLTKGMTEHPKVTVAEGFYGEIKMQITDPKESFRDFEKRYDREVESAINKLPEVIKDRINKAEEEDGSDGLVYDRFDIDQDGSKTIILKVSDFYKYPLSSAKTLCRLMLGEGQGPDRIIGEIEAYSSRDKEKFERLTQQWKEALRQVEEMIAAAGKAVASVLTADISSDWQTFDPGDTGTTDKGKVAGSAIVTLDQAKQKLKSQMFFIERINGAINGTPLDDEAILKKIEPVLAQIVDYQGLTDLLRKTIDTLNNIKADNEGKLKDLAKESGWGYVKGDVADSLKALNNLSKGVTVTVKEVLRSRQVVWEKFKKSPDILPSAIGPGNRSVTIGSDGFAEFSFDQSFIGGKKDGTRYDVATIAAEVLIELLTKKSDEVIDGTRVKRSFFQDENNEINISDFNPTQERYFRDIVGLRAEKRPIRPVGGIDLGATSSALQIKRDGNGMVLPLNQQSLEFQNIDGFTPFIINVTTFNPAAILSQIEGGGAATSG